jgi:hypothetical protein
LWSGQDDPRNQKQAEAHEVSQPHEKPPNPR